MTDKQKPASAKGWCVVTPRGALLIHSVTDTYRDAADFAEACANFTTDWKKLGFRVVRFTATEIPATTRRMVRKK